MYDPNKATSKSEYKDNIFKLNHYYSLLLLFKLFKPSATNPLLFYYVNDWGKPRTNHYNRWFNDSYWWHEKLLENDLTKDKIVFTKIEHGYDYAQHDFNMYTIVNKVKEDSMRTFLNSKISTQSSYRNIRKTIYIYIYIYIALPTKLAKRILT